METIRKIYADYLFILFVLLLGILGTVRFSWIYQQSVEIKSSEDFKVAARDRIELIKDAMETNEAVLNSVVSFYRASKDVNDEEFNIFVSQMLKDHPFVQAVDWIPEVKDDDRAAYEKQGRLTHSDFAFKEKKGDVFVEAGKRPVYYPIFLTNTENHVLRGFDLGSDPVRGPFLKHVREARTMITSEGVHLLVDPTHQRIGVLFAKPIYHDYFDEKGEKYEKFQGFILTVVPMAEMIENSLKLLKYEGTNIFIHDLSAPEGKQLLYARSTRLRDISQQEMLDDYANMSTGERAMIDVGGRNWQITILPARGFFTPGIQRETIVMLVGGILVTLMLVFYMHRRVRENERISDEVEKRTQELAHAKKQTEMILISTSEGITGLDAEGKITFINPRTTALLGYNRREMIGRDHHALLHHAQEDGAIYSGVDCPINDAILDRRSITVSNEVFWKKDGQSLPVEYTASPIVDGDEVKGAVVVFRDITERRRLEQQLQQMARYDQMTGLANRAMFMEMMKIAMARAARTGKKVALVYMDMDNFKPINDTLGHEAGDACLKAFAALVKKTVREYDTPARIGGDEFTILVDNLNDKDEGSILVERLLSQMESPIDIAGHSFRLSVSIGIAYYPDDSLDAETLLRHADSAMYQAKKDKTKKYVVYES